MKSILKNIAEAITQLDHQRFADVPEDYVVSKLYEYGFETEYSNTNQAYNCGCPICREGSSWGYKKRLFYIPDKDLVHCHNCGWSSKPYFFVREVTGFSHDDVLKDLKDEGSIPSFDSNISILRLDEDEKVDAVEELPEKYVDLTDPLQVEYYKDNYQLQQALKYVEERNLMGMVNSPKKLLFCIKDKTHRNRIIIPFYDVDGDSVLHYQSRSIQKFDKMRYLSKKHSNKTLFNIDKVDFSKDIYYITEGPIDSFCISNCIAVAGISESKTILFTPEQKTQLREFIGMERVWILDNQHMDEAALTKSKILVDLGEKIFIYPKTCPYKDLNAICVGEGISGIPESFINKFTYSDVEAMLLLNKI